VRRQLGNVGATTRQDRDQVTALEDQQGFADRTAADVERQRDLLFLDALSRLHFATNDAFGEVVSDLLGEAVRRLERHGCPSNSIDLHKRRSVAQMHGNGGVPTQRFLARIPQKSAVTDEGQY